MTLVQVMTALIRSALVAVLLSSSAISQTSTVISDANAANNVYAVGLEIHASKGMTSAESEKISRYLFHNIAKWSDNAIVLYEGDTRGGGAKVDLNVVAYISKLGKAYSLFVETTDEVALRKELMDKGISRADADALIGDPKSPLSRTSGTSWGTVLESELPENLDSIIKNITSVLRRVQQEAPPTTKLACNRRVAAYVVVESRSGAVAVRPCRFQIPLIKPDVRISRIRLSDQGGFMLSPTGGCAWSVPDGPGRASRRDTRQGRRECQLPDVGVWRTATVAADIGYGRLRRDRPCLQGPT